MDTQRGKRELISDLSGGVNQFADPSKIADNEFTVYDNLIGWAQGRFFNATKRKGFERYDTATTNSQAEIQNIVQYINPGTTKSLNQLLIKSASTVEYLSGSSLVDIATGLGSGKVDFAFLGTNLYVAGLKNGSNAKITNKFYNGNDWLDVGAIPCNNIGISPTGAGAGSVIDAGTYYYVITFLYDGKQESGAIGGSTNSGAADLKQVNLGSGKTGINITGIPTGNARVTARKIYRSNGTDPGNVYFVGAIQDNVATTFTDIVPNSELGTPIPITDFFELKRPYISKYHVNHPDRIVQGNLEGELYKAIPSADITLAGATDLGSGAMGTGVYKYRFYKAWIREDVNAGNIKDIVISQALEKTVTLSGGQNAVDITYSGSSEWFQYILFTRTDVGGSTFKMNYLDDYPRRKSVFTPLRDLRADAQYAPVSLNELGDSRNEYNNSIAWSAAGKPDLFPSNNILEIGGTDQEITGLFSEDNRMIVFKERSIYQVSTEVSDSRYWKFRKLVEHIGSPHRWAITQLPAGGYFFYGNDSNFYLWDGFNQPVRISDPIYSEAQQITAVHVRYDKIRNWVWCVYDISGTAGRVLIYDFNNGKWYPFKENTTALKLGSPYQLTDGTMIFGGTNYGSLMKYGTNNQDNLNTTGSTFANVGILVKLQTRTYDTWRAIKEFLGRLWASGTGTMNIYYGVDGGEGAPVTAPIASDIAIIRKPVNVKAKEFYVRMENAENIALSFKRIGHSYEPAHTESDGF